MTPASSRLDPRRHQRRPAAAAALLSSSGGMATAALSLMLMLLAAAAEARIGIDSDGGYTGIVIKVDSSVPQEDCAALLRGIKSVLHQSSAALYEALDSKVYFKSVSVVVPAGWSDEKCNMTVREPRGERPYRFGDFSITAKEHPIYAHEPFTQQSKKCGQPGEQTTLQYSFFMQQDSGRNAKRLVAEWSKLRYGIFDEYGFNQDHMYPNYFFHKGKILPTGTANAAVEGAWVNRDGDHGCNPLSKEEECFFKPSDANNANVTCSLGYLNRLPNVTTYCNSADTRHLPMAPTKHNILCEGRAALDVIYSHSDFSRIAKSNSRRSLSGLDPEVLVFREPDPQYVLVMETTTAMDEHGEWRWINKAAQKFIRYDLAVHSSLAIVTFNNKSEVEHSMTRVRNNEVRARLADTIPDKYHLVRSSRRCVLCAIQQVVHDVLSPETLAGTHIVLLTGASREPINAQDRQILQNYITDYNLKLSALLLEPDNESEVAFFDRVSQLNGGRTHLLRTFSDDAIDFYLNLNEAFSDVIQSDVVQSDKAFWGNQPQVIYKKSFDVGGRKPSTGSFLIDSTFGRDTVFGIYVEDEEDHRIRRVVFTDPKGKKYGPFDRMSSTYDLINFKTINFPSGQGPPFNSPRLVGMTWQYEIEWHAAGRSQVPQRKSTVVVTSKPGRVREELIYIHSWSSFEGNGSVSVAEPLTIYAQVRIGSEPVIGARVLAEVNAESAQGELIRMAPLEMLDDGFGDPDLISGDGIYSLHLTRFPLSGRYSVNIRVDDNENRAFLATTVAKPAARKAPSQSQLPVAPCCGSVVALNPKHTEKIGIFKREVAGPVFHLAEVPRQSQDVVPPSRIGDLKVTQMSGEMKDHLVATWTAPGGDFNVGSVSSYRFVYSEDIATLLDPRAKPDVLLSFDRYEQAGTRSSFDFQFPKYDKDYYLAAYAFDLSGNRGKISNLVHVRVAAPPKTKILTPADNDTSKIFSLGGGKDMNWVLIGIISGVLGVLLIISLAAIAYYWVMTRRGKQKDRGSGEKAGSTSSVIASGSGSSSDETDSSSFDSDIKNIMAINPLGPALTTAGPVNGPVPVHHNHGHPGHGHHHPLNAPSSVDSGMSSGGGNDSATHTPVYWSASQLLSKLDHSQHPHPNPGPYVHPGPQSLQPQVANGTPPGVVATGPQSFQNLSFNESLRYSASSGLQVPHPGPSSDWASNYGHVIPEEYTITVTDSGNSSAKVPPPVMPKPRNITQV